MADHRNDTHTHDGTGWTASEYRHHEYHPEEPRLTFEEWYVWQMAISAAENQQAPQ